MSENDLKNEFIIHHVEKRDGRWRISYERRSEWKPTTVFLDELLAELDAKAAREEARNGN